MKNGDLPAMPVSTSESICQMTGTLKPEFAGLSKRERFAMHFAGHIWSQYQNDGTSVQYDNWREGVCVESIRLADQLLTELEKTK